MIDTVRNDICTAISRLAVIRQFVWETFPKDIDLLNYISSVSGKWFNLLKRYANSDSNDVALGAVISLAIDMESMSISNMLTTKGIGVAADGSLFRKGIIHNVVVE